MSERVDAFIAYANHFLFLNYILFIKKLNYLYISLLLLKKKYKNTKIS